ncbi:MAG: hypothetical protein KJ063_23890 [Anaerolineae bacterium]|nr:hypothetical protein [Anaerolineae bacterium]
MITKYSDALGVTAEELWCEGAFDGYVEIDACFHIDPHLLESTKIPELQPAYQRVKDYFEVVLRLLEASKQPGDVFFKGAWKRLQFPEFPYVSLGYSLHRSGGNGIGEKLALAITDTAVQIVEAGIKDPVIFELVGVLEEGIGADRISDMTAHIIAGDLLAFSERVARNLQLRTIRYEHDGRWFEVPFDPERKRPLILVPHEILRPLPIALVWDDIDAVCAYNQRLREALNDVIGKTWGEAFRKAKKHEIRELLLRNPELLRDLVRQYKEKPAVPYDFARDPDGIMIWAEVAHEWAEKYPLLLDTVSVVTPEQLQGVVRRICKHYGRLLERYGLNMLLHDDDDKLRKERFARLLFFGMAEAYCQANNFDLNLVQQGGREMVLFKLSRGYNARLFVTVKYSSNPHLCNQYEEAITTYSKGDQDEEIVFLVVRTKPSNEVIETLRRLQFEARESGQAIPELMIVDGRISDVSQGILWELGADDEWLAKQSEIPQVTPLTLNEEMVSGIPDETVRPKVNKETILQRKQPGRRPDPENDIAFQKILEGNQTDKAWTDAFDYWCREKGLADPKKAERDAFKKAMERAEKRQGQTE